MLCTIGNFDLKWTPLICLVFYISALAIQIRGGIVFWGANIILAVISLVILVIYCLVSLAYVDFEANAGQLSTDTNTSELFLFPSLSIQ